jgi:hypothetical protein
MSGTVTAVALAHVWLARPLLVSSYPTHSGTRDSIMEQIIECIIAGGPQHGLVRRQLWDSEYSAMPVLSTIDGQICIAAAHRPVGNGNGTPCYILLHPKATGEQFRDLLATVSCRRVSAFAPSSGAGRRTASAT